MASAAAAVQFEDGCDPRCQCVRCFVDWCHQSPLNEPTEPAPEVLRARKLARGRRREDGGRGYITNSEDLQECIARLTARAIDNPPDSEPDQATPEPVADWRTAIPLIEPRRRKLTEADRKAGQRFLDSIGAGVKLDDGKVVADWCKRETLRWWRKRAAAAAVSEPERDAVAEAQAMRKDGMSYGQIAEALGIGKSQAWRWCNP